LRVFTLVFLTTKIGRFPMNPNSICLDTNQDKRSFTISGMLVADSHPNRKLSELAFPFSDYLN
jgi:hypothetical protein